MLTNHHNTFVEITGTASIWKVWRSTDELFSYREIARTEGADATTNTELVQTQKSNSKDMFAVLAEKIAMLDVDELATLIKGLETQETEPQ
ncbi:hypothetical protein OAG68_02920 [bacterium]|nr:hypothetical protein [bacterium]